jgi:hypothetical protein
MKALSTVVIDCVLGPSTKGRIVTQMPEGTQYSEDGQWWWDGQEWQAVVQDEAELQSAPKVVQEGVPLQAEAETLSDEEWQAVINDVASSAYDEIVSQPDIAALIASAPDAFDLNDLGQLIQQLVTEEAATV